jgi:DNA-binding PucR family transcriptional regulator
LASQERAVLHRLQEEVLGDLIAYDHRHRGDLLATLEAYFAGGRNLTAAASALDTHRNTISYRLERVQSMLGATLDDPGTDLALHLAPNVRQVLAASAPRHPSDIGRCDRPPAFGSRSR